MQAEIYKLDFLEERKDREKARGELVDLLKAKEHQDTLFYEERAQLYKEINTYTQECDSLRTALEAMYQKTSRDVIGQLQLRVEQLGREKEELERAVTEYKPGKTETEAAVFGKGGSWSCPVSQVLRHPPIIPVKCRCPSFSWQREKSL